MIDRQKIRDFTKNLYVVLTWMVAILLCLFLLAGAFSLHPLIGSIVVVIYIAAVVAAIMTL